VNGVSLGPGTWGRGTGGLGRRPSRKPVGEDIVLSRTQNGVALSPADACFASKRNLRTDNLSNSSQLAGRLGV
jgi:hypothetical protein